jgi:hypothetical protein
VGKWGDAGVLCLPLPSHPPLSPEPQATPDEASIQTHARPPRPGARRSRPASRAAGGGVHMTAAPAPRPCCNGSLAPCAEHSSCCLVVAASLSRAPSTVRLLLVDDATFDTMQCGCCWLSCAAVHSIGERIERLESLESKFLQCVSVLSVECWRSYHEIESDTESPVRVRNRCAIALSQGSTSICYATPLLTT